MNFLPKDDGSPALQQSCFVALTGLVVTLYLYDRSNKNKRERKKYARPWKKVPGSLPLLGHLPYIGGIPNLISKLEEWADEYGGDENGCFEIDMPGVNYLVVCREDRALEILKQRPKKVYRPAPLREGTDSIGAKGVFSAEGEQWKQEHKVVAAALNRSNTEDYLPILKHMVTNLIQKWEKQDSDVQYRDDMKIVTVAINDDLGGMTADSICKVMLDRDYDFLNHPDSTVAKNVRTMMKGALNRALCPIWYWRIPVIGQYLDGAGFAVRNVWEIVRNAVVECQASASGSNKSTFLHKLISLIRTEKSSISRDRIIGNAITLFLAGTDTTEKSLVQALYLLATKPELQQELRNEIIDLDLKTASLDDLYTKAPHLKSFLHETHRHIAMPMLMLSTVEEIPFCGTTLPAGQDIFMLNRYYSTQTKNPTSDVPTGVGQAMPSNEFHPYRYLVKNEKGDSVCPDPSNKATGFLPFGYGVRMCPGRRYSEILSYSALIAILQTFDFELAPNHPSVEQVYDAIAISPSCDIQLQLTKRK